MNYLNRFEILIGTDNLDKLKKARVLIIGIGGVGGYTAESLARSGIGYLHIVDYDVIDETNINRQIIALHSNIGEYKVDVMRKRIQDINPNIEIKTSKEFINAENINEYINNVDFVVDACDTVSTKLNIILTCKKLNIPFISCMGTGNKMDPSKLKIMDISKTSYDSLAKKIRKFVKDNRIKGKIMVICSDEIKYSQVTQPIPSNAFVPAVAGLLATSYVINQIIK